MKLIDKCSPFSLFPHSGTWGISNNVKCQGLVITEHYPSSFHTNSSQYCATFSFLSFCPRRLIDLLTYSRGSFVLKFVDKPENWLPLTQKTFSGSVTNCSPRGAISLTLSQNNRLGIMSFRHWTYLGLAWVLGWSKDWVKKISNVFTLSQNNMYIWGLWRSVAVFL